MTISNSQKNIGYILKLFRIANNLVVKDLAEMMGVSSTYITEIEAGNKNPSLSTLDKFSKAFNINKSIIVYFDEVKEKYNYDYQIILLKILEIYVNDINPLE